MVGWGDGQGHLRNGALAVFERDRATGRLTWRDIHPRVADAGRISDQEGTQVLLSPDARFVVVGNGGPLLGFERDPATGRQTEEMFTVFRTETSTGKLTFLGAVGLRPGDAFPTSGFAFGPKSARLYASPFGVVEQHYRELAVTSLAWNSASGALLELDTARAPAVNVRIGDLGSEAAGLAVTPDERYVYARDAIQSQLAVFRADPATGHLTFVERHLPKRVGLGAGGRTVAVSPDGMTVAAAGIDSTDDIHVFARCSGDFSSDDPDDSCGAISDEFQAAVCELDRVRSPGFCDAAGSALVRRLTKPIRRATQFLERASERRGTRAADRLLRRASTSLLRIRGIARGAPGGTTQARCAAEILAVVDRLQPAVTCFGR